MKIFLHEIHDQDAELDFTQNDRWVLEAIERVDERADDLLDSESAFQSGHKPATPPVPRQANVHLSLRKVDDVIVISGKIRTHVKLLCSRCVKNFQLPCSLGFSALFCKDPVMAGVAHLQHSKPMGQNKGFARHAHEARDSDSFGGSGDSGNPDESGSGSEIVSETNKDLDITYLSEDYIDLAEVITEQVRLQIPFQPLCQENCKGMCSQCGADLNVGRCACSKLTQSSPFSVLRDLKI